MVRKIRKLSRIAHKSALTAKKSNTNRTAKILSVKKTNDASESKSSVARLSIYIYWFIILFFICATFYIIGRGQEILKKVQPAMDNVEIIDGVSDMSDADRLQMSQKYSVSGKEKLLAGDASGAIYDLSIAIQANPKSSDSYVFRAEAYMQNADYNNAMSDVNDAIEINSENAVAYYDRALLNIKIENYAAALSDLNSALTSYQKTPNDVLSVADIYAKRAQLNLWTKNWSAAAADYNSAISWDAGNADYYSGRAEALTALGQYDAALIDYMNAARVVSEKIQKAATTAEREKMSRDAIGYFEKSGAIRVSKGDLEAAAGDLESAHMIAVALGDTEMANRLKILIMNIQ